MGSHQIITMLVASYIVLQTFGLVSGFYERDSPPPCLEHEKTWHADDVLDVTTGSSSEFECQLECAEKADCHSFTWYTAEHPYYPTICVMFHSTYRQELCHECVSGPASCTCSGENGCILSEDNVIDIIPNTLTELECMGLCYGHQNCGMYTWFDVKHTFEHFCILLSYCDNYDYECNDCFSGPPVCNSTSLTTSPPEPTTTDEFTTITPESKTELVILTENSILTLPSFDDSGCNLDLPESSKIHGVAGVVEDSNEELQLIVCFVEGCWISNQSQWISIDMGQQRIKAAASGDGSGGLFVSGGISYGSFLRSTEIFKDGVWTQGPYLPNRLHNHCQVEVNGKVMITGGLQDEYTYAKTYSYTLDEDNRWRSAASLSEGRSSHACLAFHDKVYVFGGRGRTEDDILTSVEIYNPVENRWNNGPSLPQALREPQAFTHDDVIYVVGGLDMNGTINSQIFYLSGPYFSNWITHSRTLDLDSSRMFVSPPILTNDFLNC